ncbi:MAG: hypothetical protein H0V44_14020, partial [Planctomycetes bacterium]|nr:hypothetical protein [Planctomycetota bacterium]
MSLTTEDVEAIGNLLDQRLEKYDRKQRGRRRFWLWFWILLFVVSTVASLVAARELMAQAQGYVDRLGEEERKWSEMKLAYQAELARDRQMQKERAEAETHAHYDSAKPQAQYEADLVRNTLKLFSKTKTMQDKVAKLDPDDPDAQLQAMEDTAALTSDAMGMVMQMLLRNTDP